MRVLSQEVAMPDLTFWTLTEAELGVISDGAGCGAKGANVPDWIFLDACLQHDFEYWVGGPDRWRRGADRRFLLNMLAAAKAADGWYRRWCYRGLAYAYYVGVRSFARKFWYRGQPRGRAELDAALLEAGVQSGSEG